MNELIYYDQITQSLSKAVKWGGENLDSVPGLLKMVLEQEMWKRRIVVMTGQEQQFETFKAYIEASAPEGLGASESTIMRLCKDTDVMPLLEKELKKKLNENGANQHSEDITRNTLAPAQQGNSREYTIARLERDGYSDLAQQVISREISAAEARRQAGWEKKKVTIRMDDPTSAAATIVKNMPREQIDELISLLLKAIHEL